MAKKKSNKVVEQTEVLEQADVKLVEVNDSAIEPNEYFKILKESVNQISSDRLKASLSQIAEHLIRARENGQKSLIERLSFTYDVICKEQVLYDNNFATFVYQDDIKELLDKTKHIKIIELERFPRIIPAANSEHIQKAKQLGLFDEFCVVFTDLTDNNYQTESEREYVARNRDPVVFGYFRNSNTGIKHHRFYLITDWEDADCDLTFDKLLNKMEEEGIDRGAFSIGQDEEYIREIVKTTLESMKPVNTLSRLTVTAKVHNKTFWERFTNVFRKN